MTQNYETDSASSAGERLKQAREQAGLSVEKIGKDLYLDTRIIQAIETNRFNELGAPVYAKGYIRKYARLVGLPEEDVLDQYQKSPHAAPLPVLIPVALGSIPESRQPLPHWVRWLVLVIIVVAGLTTLLTLRPAEDEPATQGALISRPLLNAQTDSSPSTASGATALTDSPLAALQNQTPAGAITLRFNFSGDSWVEVYDAQNQQVFNNLGTADTVREVTASPPLRVVLGAASVVHVSVDSRETDIPTRAIDGNVAKFAVKADGSLE
jgi:cytoskeleton protein RodZ